MTELPPVDHSWSVRVIAGYFYDADDPRRGRLAEEGIDALRRWRNGTGSPEDMERALRIGMKGGTVAELYDTSEIVQLAELVRNGLAHSELKPSGQVFGTNLATVHFEWPEYASLHGFRVSWKYEERFAVAIDGEHERWFESPALAQKLGAAVAKQAIRSSIWTDPELRKPMVVPALDSAGQIEPAETAAPGGSTRNVR